MIVNYDSPLAKIKLGEELDDTRIRRVETTNDYPWYSKTNKVLGKKPIYYYYELSLSGDSMIRGWRFNRFATDYKPYEACDFVCISAIKLELAKKR